MALHDEIDEVFNLVRDNGKKLDRGPTIGGMWTVDTWVMYEGEPNEVRVQLMDEGYTHAIHTSELQVYATYNRPAVYSRGEPKDVVALLTVLQYAIIQG